MIQILFVLLLIYILCTLYFPERREHLITATDLVRRNRWNRNGWLIPSVWLPFYEFEATYQGSPPADYGVQFYKKKDFRDLLGTLGPGVYPDLDDDDVDMEKRIESMKIPRGLKVRLYDDNYKSGEDFDEDDFIHEFVGDYKDSTEFKSDKAKSMKIIANE